MSTLQDELKFAVKNKKENALSLALQVFNKIQGIELSKITNLDSGVADEFQNKIDEHEMLRSDESVSQTLKSELYKLRSSLDDKSSPSLSQIKQYHKKGILGLDDEQVHKVIDSDLNDFKEASDHLENIYDELENKEQTMIALSDAYSQGIKYYNSKSNENIDYIKEKDEKLENMIEKEVSIRIFNLSFRYLMHMLSTRETYCFKMIIITLT